MEFINGTIVGMVHTLIGHPLDTIKSINQYNNQKKKYQIYKINTLYKGITYPLIGNTIIGGSMFYVYDRFNKVVNNNFIAGMLTGFTISPMINFFDVYKIRNQLSLNIKINKKLLLRGMPITCIRESVASTFYFGIYNNLSKKNNSFISGSIAGASSILITYPLDVAKTRIQSNKAVNISEAFRQKYLWKGLSVSLFRSIFLAGFSFTVYDMVKNNTTNQQDKES